MPRLRRAEDDVVLGNGDCHRHAEPFADSFRRDIALFNVAVEDECQVILGLPEVAPDIQKSMDVTNVGDLLRGDENDLVCTFQAPPGRAR